jgi:hypothetical protein
MPDSTQSRHTEARPSPAPSWPTTEPIGPKPSVNRGAALTRASVARDSRRTKKGPAWCHPDGARKSLVSALPGTKDMK